MPSGSDEGLTPALNNRPLRPRSPARRQPEDRDRRRNDGAGSDPGTHPPARRTGLRGLVPGLQIVVGDQPSRRGAAEVPEGAEILSTVADQHRAVEFRVAADIVIVARVERRSIGREPGFVRTEVTARNIAPSLRASAQSTTRSPRSRITIRLPVGASAAARVAPRCPSRQSRCPGRPSSRASHLSHRSKATAFPC